MTEDSNKQQISIQLTADEKRSLDAYADCIGTSSQRLIEVLVADFCDYWNELGAMARSLDDISVTTESGIKALGNLARKAREDVGWSMQDLATELNLKIGYHISTSVISDLENGRREPQWNTLAKLVKLNYIKSPNGKPYSVTDLFHVACEMLDPMTGEPEEELAAIVLELLRDRLGEGDEAIG